MHQQPSDYITKNIYRRVDADLRPSSVVVHLKIGISIFVGGFLSLFLCGQMGLGLTSFAVSAHQSLMTAYGAIGCTIVCGLVFAVVPVAILRFISSALQFRVLIRREWPVSVFWILACGGLIFVRSGRTEEIGTLFLWAAAALASFNAMSYLTDRGHTAVNQILTSRVL